MTDRTLRRIVWLSIAAWVITGLGWLIAFGAEKIVAVSMWVTGQ